MPPLTRKPLQKRTPWGTVFLLLSLMVLASACPFMPWALLGKHLSQDLGWTLQDIIVEGRVHTDSNRLLETVDAQRGIPLIEISLPSLAQRISSLPWIRHTEITRLWPHGLKIYLDERIPVARWQMNNIISLVDAEGIVLERLTQDTPSVTQQFSHLPLIVGEGAPTAAPLFLPRLSQYQFFPSVQAASYVSQHRWDIYIHDVQIKLPEHNLEEALKKLDSLFISRTLNALKILDLRLFPKIVVVPRNAPST